MLCNCEKKTTFNIHDIVELTKDMAKNLIYEQRKNNIAVSIINYSIDCNLYIYI